MITTHRVIGHREWPINTQDSLEVFDALKNEMLFGLASSEPQVVSWRLPVPDSHSEHLVADLDQLRDDLNRLFATLAPVPNGRVG